VPIEFLVIGNERAALMLREFPHVLGEEIEAASVDASLWLEAGAKMFMAPHSRTGNLERNIQGDVRHIPDRPTWEVLLKVGMQAPYGIYVNFGTGIYHVSADGTPDPHTPWVIRPNPPRRALRFMVHGQPVFRRSVVHPGSKPVMFIQKSFLTNEERIRLRYHAIPGRTIRRLELTP
jgi:hypothetical protein